LPSISNTTPLYLGGGRFFVDRLVYNSNYYCLETTQCVRESAHRETCALTEKKLNLICPMLKALAMGQTINISAYCCASGYEIAANFCVFHCSVRNCKRTQRLVAMQLKNGGLDIRQAATQCTTHERGLKTCFCTYVRPLLEFACQIWSPRYR